MLAQSAGRPALSAGTPADARLLMASMRQAYGAGPDLVRVEDVVIATRSGSIGGRIYAGTDTPSGLIVYFHGGGWVIGGLDDFDAFARVMAQRSGCALLLVDYRLAPEFPFPAAVQDALDATLWAWHAMPDLAGARVPLVVAGDSAGGNLAAIVAGELCAAVPIALQLLIYPVVAGDFDTPSYRAFATGLPLAREDMIWFCRHYAPGVAHSERLLHPAARTDLQGLPPAHVVTAEYDVLRDECDAYAVSLGNAGIPVTTRRYDGLTHGFIRLHNLVDTADAALGDMALVIAEACRHAYPIAAANKERHA